ncbi:MAG: hypothetical protein JW982_03810 [Spirochaetes bacterium]|nr:hypothetical protein [Spirochaetota bacterium]
MDNILLNTSANMDGYFYDEITIASKIHKIKSTLIFKDLIMMINDEICCGKISGMLTEYQNHPAERWETFYYSLNSEEIDILSNARHKYKISISKLAFMAFVLFWDALLFRYADRLKMTRSAIDQNSYVKNDNKYKCFTDIFTKRLQIKQKE